MGMIWLGLGFSGFGVMLFLAAKAEALKLVSEAQAEAIRRRADYEFGQQKE